MDAGIWCSIYNSNLCRHGRGDLPSESEDWTEPHLSWLELVHKPYSGHCLWAGGLWVSISVWVLIFRSATVINLCRKWIQMTSSDCFCPRQCLTCAVGGHGDGPRPPVAVWWAVFHTICLMLSEIPTLDEFQPNTEHSFKCAFSICLKFCACVWLQDLTLQGLPQSQQVTRPESEADESSSQSLPQP